MATNYDGSVVIRTALETDGFTAGSQDLKRAAEEAASKIDNISAATRASIDKQVRSFGRLNDAYSQQEDYIEALRAEYEELSQTQVESDEYKAVNAEIAKLDQQLDAAADKVDKMVALYGQSAVEGNRSFQALQYDIDRMNERYEELIARRKELEETGGAYVSADTTGVENRLTAAEEKHNSLLEKLNDNYLTLRDRIRSAGKEGEKAHKTVAKHTGISFKKVLQYGFGIRSVFVLFRKLRAAAKESLGIMAQYDPQLNQVISRFMTSAKQLKADIGTLIQPLVQKLAPIVTALLDRIHSGIIAISQFFAALVGQDYIEVATVATVDWAGALNDVADASERVNESLGSYDKLEMISGTAEADAKATKNNMQLTKDTVKYVKQALDEGSWYVRLGRKLSGVFQTAIDWIKKKLEDPEEFLKTLGIAAVGIKLGKMLLAGVATSGFGTGISALLPKAALITVTAVLGYKIGNKIYDELPDDWKGFLDEIFGGDPNNENDTGVVDEYIDAAKKSGKSLLEKIAENATMVWDSFVQMLGYGGSQVNVPEETDEADPSYWTSVWDRVKQGVKNGAEALDKSAKYAADRSGIKEDLRWYWENFKHHFSQVTGVEKNIDYHAPTRLPPSVKRDMEKNATAFFTLSKNYMDEKAPSIWKGIVKSPMALVFSTNFEQKWNKTPAEAFQQIRDSISNAWDDPSNAIKTGLSNISSAFKNLWNSVWKTPEQNGEGARESFNKAGRGLRSAWEAKDNPVKGTLQSIKDGVKSLWNNIFDTKEMENNGRKIGDSVANGLNSVAKQADSTGSALNSALLNVGKKISEGINKGTLSVPVTFTGQATPTGTGKPNLPPINTTVTITLDGKTISQTVFKEAEKAAKQTGTGAKATLHYVYA